MTEIKNTRFVELDLLRGYAVLIVILLHMDLLCPAGHFTRLDLMEMPNLRVGVDVFFVISGYVIAKSLAPLWDVTSSASALAMKDVPLTFYRKRLVRLWPASTFWLVMCLILSLLFRGHAAWPPPWEVAGKLASGALYIFNFQELAYNSALGYFWSLSVEWQFYMLFPLLLLLVRDDRLRLALLFAATLVSVVLRPGGDLWWLFRFDGIAFGILIFALRDRIKIALPFQESTPPWLVSAGFTLLALLACVVLPGITTDHRLGYFFASAIAAILVAAATMQRGLVSDFGLGPLVRWLGSRSYSLYLCHIPAVMTVVSLLDFAWPNWAATTSFSPLWIYCGYGGLAIAVAAELTYRLIERPCFEASHRIRLFDGTRADAR